MDIQQKQLQEYDLRRKQAVDNFITRLPILAIGELEPLLRQIVEGQLEMIAADFYHLGVADGIMMTNFYNASFAAK